LAVEQGGEALRRLVVLGPGLVVAGVLGVGGGQAHHGGQAQQAQHGFHRCVLLGASGGRKPPAANLIPLTRTPTGGLRPPLAFPRRHLMDIPHLHDWPTTPEEAIELQRRLAGQVVVDAPLAECALMAGADISYNKYSSTVYAGVVVLRTSD